MPPFLTSCVLSNENFTLLGAPVPLLLSYRDSFSLFLPKRDIFPISLLSWYILIPCLLLKKPLKFLKKKLNIPVVIVVAYLSACLFQFLKVVFLWKRLKFEHFVIAAK